MRALAFIAIVVGGSAHAAPESAPQAPADLEIDVSKLVLEQPRKPPPQKTLVLCMVGQQSECEEACTGGSAPSCARLGWTLATGGADNALLPMMKFDQDFAGAEKAFDKACKLGFQPACVDAEMARRGLKKKPNEAQLRGACKAGYGRACSDLTDSAVGDKAKIALYEQGCAGGDGEACMAVADSKADLKEQLAWYSKAFATPTKMKVPLACPTGTQAVRTVSAITFTWTLYSPKWSCGRFDPQTRRFVGDGPYLEFASEEDEAVYPYGVITERGVMVAGKREGVVEHWNGRGHLVSSKTYKADREEGIAFDLMRSRDGGIESVTRTTEVAGKREGESRRVSSYDDRQFRRFELGQYAAGQKTGTWITTRVETKRVEKVERFVAGKHEGNIDHFDEKTGLLEQRDTYAAGKATKGLRYTKGKLSSEVVFVDGKRSEERELGPDGKVKAITSYDDDGYTRRGRKIRDKRGNLVDDPDGY